MNNEFNEDKRTLTRRRVVSILSVCIFIAFFVVAAIFIGAPLVEYMSQPQAFRDWVDSAGAWGRIAFVGMTLLQIIVAVIPGEPLEIGAGYAFGWLEGTGLCLIGILIGSALIYLFSKYCGAKAVYAFYPKEKLDSLEFLQSSDRLNALVFLLFFIPGTPKDMLTYFIGLTKMKLGTFLLIAVTARLPSVLTSTVGGGALGDSSYVFAVIVFAVTGAVSLAGIFIWRAFMKKRAAAGKTPPPESAGDGGNGAA